MTDKEINPLLPPKEEPKETVMPGRAGDVLPPSSVDGDAGAIDVENPGAMIADANPEGNDGGEDVLSRRKVLSIAALLVSSMAVGTGILRLLNGGDENNSSPKPSEGESTTIPAIATPNTSNTTSSTPEKETCVDAWEMPGVDHGKEHRWFANGIEEIKQAKTPEEARQAIGVWLNGNNKHLGIKHDAVLLAAAYNMLVKPTEKVVASDLMTTEGCANNKAIEIATELSTFLAIADVLAGAPQSDWHNTGTNEAGQVTQANGVAGSSEDRKGVVIVVDGSPTACVLGRCGQITIPGGNIPEDIPEGETDNSKYDDAILPGDNNVPADQDPGTPDNPGAGPAGQEPGDDGYLPQETNPPVSTTTESSTTTTHPTPATTGTQPTAPPAPPTTGAVPPNTGTTPPTPPVD